MRGRVGTCFVVVGWAFFSVCLIYIHGAFIIVVGLVTLFLVAAAVTSRELPYNKHSKGVFVVLPITWRDVRHNRRAALIRRKERCKDADQACVELMNVLDFEERNLRLPVLEAERDAASREYERLSEDIERMEAAWEREDKERAYRKLTSS